MDWLTFAVELTKALAWPVTTVIVTMLFRKPLADLIPFLKSLKYKDLEVEFSKGVEEVKQEALVAIPQPAEIPNSEDQTRSPLAQLAEVSPRSAVLEAWRTVESEAIACVTRNNLAPESDSLKGHSRIGHALLQAGVMNKDQFKVFHRLRELRNLAAHADDFTLGIEDAIDYLDSAMRLAVHLRAN
ncbi:hypothetical protein GTP41_12460 [Pseudoduganella sp. DS3]|uniref:DUF4145 domain-containing protein n=1 Tax=Pseudoduganella guangdongensis TaxID=2692179 RepID=A0A6N9HII4_9BURK|nr:DUF4145 domain-containing protein [Pseudoduganella guangdongensis]MYN02913.1 hypothetical protein [Pseudoduganella guangdongensis]